MEYGPLPPRCHSDRISRRAWLALMLFVCLSNGYVFAGTIRSDVPDSSYTTLATQAAYLPVGELNYTINGQSFTASGILISDRWVLTAGHVTADLNSVSSLTFTVGGYVYNWSQVITNTNWTANPSPGINPYDIGLVQLNTSVTNVTPAVRYAGSSELGQTATIIGYGATGTGLTGYSAATAGTRRAGNNVLDVLGNTVGDSANYLMADFDNPASTAASSFGANTALPLEYSVAPGDSGGGAFITINGVTRLAGITSFGQAGPVGSGNTTLAAKYGDIMGFTRVAVFNDWIDDLTASQWVSTTSQYAGNTGVWTNNFFPNNYGSSILAFSTVTGAFTASFQNNDNFQKILVQAGNVTLDFGTKTTITNSPMLNGSVVVGRDSGDSATLNVTNGILSSVDAFLARDAGSTGTLVVGTGGTWTLSDSLYIGGSNTASGGAGTLIVNSGRTATVTGTLKMWNASSVVNAAGTVSVGTLDFSTGTITGSTGGAVSLTGSASVWSGGSVTTGGNLSVASGATLTLSGSGNKELAGGRLTNAGTIVWSNGNITSSTTTPGNIVNQATGVFNIQSSQAWNYSSATRPVFTNNGVIRKTSAIGGTTINWTLDNAAGSQVDIQSGSLSVAGGGTSSGATFKTSSSTVLTFSAPYTFNAADTFTANGMVNFNAGNANIGSMTGTGGVSVGTGATVSANQVTLSTLTVNGAASNRTAKFTLNSSGTGPAGANSAVSHVSSLTLANDGATIPLSVPTTPYTTSLRTYYGSLDVKNNDLIIDGNANNSLAAVTDMIRGGMGNTTTRTWNGIGLTSSEAATGTYAGKSGLGVIRNVVNPASALGGTNTALYTSFDGVTLTGDEILVKYTWYGDLNLDGKVTSLDYALLDAGLAGARQSDNQPGWFFGDINLDGVVNSTDSSLMNAGFQAYKNAGTQVLPEPSTLVLLGCALGVLLLRRRTPR